MHATRETGPGVRNVFAGGDRTQLKINQPVIREVSANQSQSAEMICFVGDPNEPVGSDSKEFRTMLTVVLQHARNLGEHGVS